MMCVAMGADSERTIMSSGLLILRLCSLFVHTISQLHTIAECRFTSDEPIAELSTSGKCGKAGHRNIRRFIPFCPIWFLPPDAVRWRGICYGDVAVCVCVCVCVCHVDVCAQTTESIIMQPSPDCSPAILVFPTPNMNPIARGDLNHHR